ncbi:hypothetical protein [Streptosporangium sp. NPDC006007]|uniref:hypothetical protein n=1 Tax=Streptosporangium sp. NPDC006007 TaxID=3154575 RepID=UPI0033A016A2
MSFTPLILTHPRLPGVELHRGPRSGEAYLIAPAVRLPPADCADVGAWLTEQSREDPSAPQRWTTKSGSPPQRRAAPQPRPA